MNLTVLIGPQPTETAGYRPLAAAEPAPLTIIALAFASWHDIVGTLAWWLMSSVFRAVAGSWPIANENRETSPASTNRRVAGATSRVAAGCHRILSRTWSPVEGRLVRRATPLSLTSCAVTDPPGSAAKLIQSSGSSAWLSAAWSAGASFATTVPFGVPAAWSSDTQPCCRMVAKPTAHLSGDPSWLFEQPSVEKKDLFCKK